MPGQTRVHSDNNRLTFFADRFAHPRTVLAFSLVIVPTLAVLADKSTVPTLIVATVLALPGAWFHGWRPASPSLGTVALGVGVAGWAAIASSWSLEPAGGISISLRLLSLMVCAWMLSDMVARVPNRRDPNGRRLARCAVIGLSIAAAVLVIEMLFDMPIKGTVKGLWGHVDVHGSETNRGGTFLLMALCLVLPLTPLATEHRGPVTFGLCALSLAAIAIGESGTNQIAALAGLGFLGVSWFGRTARLSVWVAAICIGVVAMPWVAQGLFNAGLHQVDGLGSSVQHRIHIWNYVSDWALEKPIFGWGYDSSADLGNRGVEPFKGYDSVVPLHPHNAALQIWLELGAIGILLALAVLVRLVRATEAAGPAWAPWLGAAAIAGLVAANLGYGLWQTQWIAALAWLSCYARLAVLIAPRTHDPHRDP